MISGAVEEIVADAGWTKVEVVSPELGWTSEILVTDGWIASTRPVIEAVWTGLVGFLACFLCLRRQADFEGLACSVWVGGTEDPVSVPVTADASTRF